MKTNQAGLSLISTVLIILLIVIAVFAAFRIGKNARNTENYADVREALNDVVDTPTNMEITPDDVVVAEKNELDPLEKESSSSENSVGYIEGSLSYPSEFIPQMSVCAQNVETSILYCTNQVLEDEKYLYGKGYKVEVPEGTYTVYAQLPEDDYKAYFSVAVPCGLSVECNDHTPIEVEVVSGGTVDGVDTGDWYAN